MQLLFQLPSLYGLGLTPYPRWQLHHPGVRRIMGLMVPALFGVSVSQINLLLDTVLASLLPAGSVSWLYYSDRLIELPLGVFAIAIATVILPTLSTVQTQSDGADQRFSSTLQWGVEMVLLVALPATAALLCLAEPILTTLFGYGEFSPSDVNMAAYSLRAYALGLTAFMLIKVLAPGFYARQDTRTPVRIGVIAMVSNMVLNPLFIFPLLWAFNVGHAGLALATAASAWLNAGLLYRGLRKDSVLTQAPSLQFLTLQLLPAVAMMVTVLLTLSPDLQWWQGQAVLIRALTMAALVLLGALSYAVILGVMGLRLAHLRGPRDQAQR
jgi:putative peptidoglycan lipid II flippase